MKSQPSFSQILHTSPIQNHSTFLQNSALTSLFKKKCRVFRLLKIWNFFFLDIHFYQYSLLLSSHNFQIFDTKFMTFGKILADHHFVSITTHVWSFIFCQDFRRKIKYGCIFSLVLLPTGFPT